MARHLPPAPPAAVQLLRERTRRQLQPQAPQEPTPPQLEETRHQQILVAPLNLDYLPGQLREWVWVQALLESL